VVALAVDIPEKVEPQSVELLDSKGSPVDCQVQGVTPEGLFVDNKWNVPQVFLSKRFRLLVDAKALPEMGYETFHVIARRTPGRHTGSLSPGANMLENEFLRVEIAANGTLDLMDKARGAEYRGLGYLSDQGEVGNAWRHQAPARDRVVNSLGAAARTVLVEDGPLAATLRVDLALRVPREAEGGESRSGDGVVLPVTHWVRLARSARRVEVTTELDNHARDHWLRLMFPGGLRTDTSCADSHYDVVQRAIRLPDCKDWKEPVVGTYPFRTFVDLSDGKRGLAFLGEGLQEFEVFDDEARTLAITLLRAVRIKLEVSEQRKQELPDTGPQCPGRQQYRWALYPHPGDWAEGGCLREALKFTTPLRAVQFGKTAKGSAPRRWSCVELDSPSLQVAAVKKCEQRDTLIVRLYNPTDKTASGTLKFVWSVKKAWRTNLNEERRSTVRRFDGKNLSLRLGRKKIETLEVEF